MAGHRGESLNRVRSTCIGFSFGVPAALCIPTKINKNIDNLAQLLISVG
jgi:hypothetical protein